jgi:hypothetical protein
MNISPLRLALGAFSWALAASVMAQTQSAVQPIAPGVAQGVPAQAVSGRSHGFFGGLRPAPAKDGVPKPLSSPAAEVGGGAAKAPIYVCGMPVIEVDASLDPRIVLPLSDEARTARIRVIKPECHIR